MPEAKTSQPYQLPSNFPPLSRNTEPLEPREGHFLVVKDDNGCRKYPLGGEVYSIGRDQNSDICLFSMFVSRRHATLVRQQREDGSYYYQIVDGDLKGQLSVNGVWINGCKLQAHELENEDEILFGAGVSATYYLFKADDRNTKFDPFEITLIDPGSIVEESHD
ncbi:MAG: FHA domain-containing protein [Coleofasciculus sp. S288]|nr:FHA domain-containing protein [Coleofasciculus sp. S288]